MNKENISENLLQGLDYFQAKDFEKAIKIFDKIIEIDEQYGEAHYWKAQAYAAIAEKELDDVGVEREKALDSAGEGEEWAKAYVTPQEVYDEHVVPWNNLVVENYTKALKHDYNKEEIFTSLTHFLCYSSSASVGLDLDIVDSALEMALQYDAGDILEWNTIGNTFMGGSWEDPEIGFTCFNRVIHIIDGTYEYAEITTDSTKIPLIEAPETMSEGDKHAYVNALFFMHSYYAEEKDFTDYREMVWRLYNVIEDKQDIVVQLMGDIGSLMGVKNGGLSFTLPYEEIKGKFPFENFERWIYQNIVISQFKHYVKHFVKKKLQQQYGSERYWDEGVPRRIRRRAEDWKLKEKSQHPNRKPNLWRQIKIRDIQNILEDNKTWADIFEIIFKNKNWLTDHMNKICDYRNDIKKDKLILNESEIKTLEGLTGEMKDCIKSNDAC